MVSEIKKTGNAIVLLLVATTLIFSLPGCEKPKKAEEKKEVKKEEKPVVALEKEMPLKWATSQYGTPPTLSLETPEELETKDETVPDSLKELLQSRNVYQFRSNHNFYIVVNIVKYKKLAANLKGAAAGAGKELIKKYSSLKIQDKPIKVSGISAMRQDGTFIKDDEHITLSEIIVTKDKMLWQVIVEHKEGDEEAAKVKERIFNSMKIDTSLH